MRTSYVRVGYCYNPKPMLAQDQGITEDDWEAWSEGECVAKPKAPWSSRYFDREAWESERKEEKRRTEAIFRACKKTPSMCLHIARKLIEVTFLRRASIYRQHQEILANVVRRGRPLDAQLRAELNFRCATLWEKPKGDGLCAELGLLDVLRGLMAVEHGHSAQRMAIKKFNNFIDKIRESNGTPYWVTYDQGTGWIH